MRRHRRGLLAIATVFTLTSCSNAPVVTDEQTPQVITDFPAEETSNVTPLTPVLEDPAEVTAEPLPVTSPPEPTEEEEVEAVPTPEEEETPVTPTSPAPESVAPVEPELPRNFNVALTFDDGPSAWSDDILEVLLRERVPATFFVLGSEVNKYPGTALLLAESGMDVQSHTYSHPRLTNLTDEQVREQIRATTQAFVNAGLEEPTCSRPPYGARDSRTDSVFAEFGEDVVTWNVDPRDWSKPGSEAIINSVYEQVTERSKENKSSVVLLHDGGGDRTQTLEALPSIVKLLKEDGYTFTLVC